MVGLVLLDYGNSVSTNGIIESLTYGRHQVLAVLLIIIVNQLNEHLCVGSALEHISLILELFSKHLVVFDDTIVHQCQVTAHTCVRMSVGC